MKDDEKSKDENIIPEIFRKCIAYDSTTRSYIELEQKTIINSKTKITQERRFYKKSINKI